jgi:hypothetical protein
MKRFAVIAIFALGAMGCTGSGTAGSAALEIKAGGKDTSLAVKTSGSDKSVKTFTDKENKITTATSFHAVMANYDLDTKNVGTMKKPVTAADQVRLQFQLIGEEGTDQKSELKPGVYRADPKEKFMKVDYLAIATFTDGKETITSFDMNFSSSKVIGEIEVTSVTAEAISGTVNVSDGDKSVKGPFVAKIIQK